MALDPSLFLQGAQMQAQQRARNDQTVSSFFDKLAADKEKQRQLKLATATDYEGSAARVLEAQARGTQPNPDDLARAQVWDKMNSVQNAIDPTTGNVYPKNRPLFGNMPSGVGGVMGAMGTGTPTAKYESIYAPTGINPAGGAMPPVPSLPSQVVNDLGGELVMPPLGDNAGQIRGMGVTAPVGSSPKTAQKAQELNLEVDAAAAKKQAEMAAEKQFNAPIAKQKILGSLAGMKNLNEDLDRAIKNTSNLTAGLGSMTSAIAGSPAADLKATLDTIQADAAFGALQQMRDNSPTGGALGAVSEKELALLMSAQAALAQSQSPAQLKYNLTRYKAIRNSALDRVSKAYEEQYGESPDFNQAKQNLTTPSGIGYKVVE